MVVPAAVVVVVVVVVYVVAVYMICAFSSGEQNCSLYALFYVVQHFFTNLSRQREVGPLTEDVRERF